MRGTGPGNGSEDFLSPLPGLSDSRTSVPTADAVGYHLSRLPLTLVSERATLGMVLRDFRELDGGIAIMSRGLSVVLLVALLAQTASAQEPARVPILLNRPATVKAQSWPVTFGVPLKPGVCRDAAHLGIVSGKGDAVACEITRAADWPDGSVRWAHVDFEPEFAKGYFLVIGQKAFPRPAPKAKVTISRDAGKIIVTTGPARYVFSGKAGCFESICLDVNGDGVFSEEEALVARAGEAFYVIDSRGRRGVLRAKKTAVEVAGTRRAVIGVKGEYLTPDGKRNAAGLVYYTFYAGRSLVRISHKLIVTEETNGLWFRDIGMSLPVAAGPKPTATFNRDHDDLAAVSRRRFRGGEEFAMVQDVFPHFGQRESRFGIRRYTDGAARQLDAGKACGDWADLSSAQWGLAAQVPAFAEQFPKAFRIARDRLTVKLWAPESGRELDFRTDQLIRDYFGHDWIHPDHPVTKIANTAQGTAKTHEIWLYPHAKPADAKRIADFAATRSQIYATADPAYLMATGIMGPLHPKDGERFPEAETAIEDYFNRTTVASQRIFPATGYICWGIYPYGSAQGWRQRKEHGGRWYPSIHRHSRCLEYNFKRAVWILFARSGDRKYFDYARKYTRFLGDFIISNCNATCKPKGWFMQGEFDSPCCWGAFGKEAIEKGLAGRKSSINSEASCLFVASSEDIIQFVYDYFLTGDLHSRDAARMWIAAMIKETDFDTEKPAVAGGGRSEAFLRLLGSACELDHDPRILDFARRYVRRLVNPDGTINDEFPSTRKVKWGDYFGAFYYYYISTGDPLALKALLRRAEFEYRHGINQGFFGRSSPLMPMFSLLHRETGNPVYARYLAQAVTNFGRNGRVLDRLGLKVDDLNQDTTAHWGHQILTANCPTNIGIPAAIAATVSLPDAPPPLPYAVKPYPTHRTHLLLKKEKPGPATLDVFVNNCGDRKITPRLLSMRGEAAPLEILDRDFRRIRQIDWGRPDTEWRMLFEDQIFYRLRIPASVAAGVYELDLGSEVTFTVLDSDIPRILQAAPDGIVILPGRRYYFHLPNDARMVEYFTSRPVRVFNPAGSEVASEALKRGRFRFRTGGAGGTWSVISGTDKYLDKGSLGVETLVRIERVGYPRGEKEYPLVVALGDPGRLFEVEVGRFKRAFTPGEAGTPDPKNPYTRPGDRPAFGRALNLAGHFVEVGVPEDSRDAFPHARGTVEFWFRPLWSSTDAEFFTRRGNYQRLQCLKAGPVSFACSVQPDHGGRMHFLLSRMTFGVGRAGYTRTDIFLEAGRWYHVALTWNVDGENSECGIFINGRKRAHTHYRRGMPPDASPENLGDPAQRVRFGSGQYGGIATSEFYDELRVSRSVRYREDFDVPLNPFEADADTSLLMHFDGSLEGLLNGRPTSGKLVRGGRLW